MSGTFVTETPRTLDDAEEWLEALQTLWHQVVYDAESFRDHHVDDRYDFFKTMYVAFSCASVLYDLYWGLGRRHRARTVRSTMLGFYDLMTLQYSVLRQHFRPGSDLTREQVAELIFWKRAADNAVRTATKSMGGTGVHATG
jgi:hypothetical protein